MSIVGSRDRHPLSILTCGQAEGEPVADIRIPTSPVVTPAHVFVEMAGTLVILQRPQRRLLPLGCAEGITRGRQQEPASPEPLMQRVDEQSLYVSNQIRLVVRVFVRTELAKPDDVVAIDESKDITPCLLLSTNELGPVAVTMLSKTVGEHLLGYQAPVGVHPSSHMDRTQRFTVYRSSGSCFHECIVVAGVRRVRRLPTPRAYGT